MNNHPGDRDLCGSCVRVNVSAAITLWLALCFALIVPFSVNAQTWTAMSTPLFTPATALLLTDGTVICQDYVASDWWKLTPDVFGNYTNGTWTQIASMPVIQGQPYAPLYYASAVLADGRVVVVGGEYNGPFGGAVWFNGGAIYDPVADVWTQLPDSGLANIGDASSSILPNGQFMLQDPFGTDVLLLDPLTLSWNSPPPPPHGNYGKSDSNDEEGWTLLPDGTVFTVDTTNVGNSELFDYIYGNWITAGNTPGALADINSDEIGPQVLRPDGTVAVFGATGLNGIYNWKGSTTVSPAPGTWGRLPAFPFYNDGLGDPPVQLVCADAPACLLPNGNVLACASPGVYGIGLAFFELSASTNRLIPEPTTINYGDATSNYQCVLLMLPTGQALLTDESNEVEFYSPIGGANSAWAPAINSSPSSVAQGQTYTIYGTQFNGLSQNSAYGDDVQNATNYPLVRVTMNATGHVIYYRTHDHSTMAVATGNTTVSTNFDVPLTAELGAGQLVVVTNGIPSLPVPVTVTPPPVANPQTVNVAHNMSASILLTGTDPNNLPLVFQLATQPANGTLSGLNPNTGAVTYTPNTNYQGRDSFTFTVSDGALTSLPGTVTLNVAPGKPIANPQTVSVKHDAGTQITLTGSDPLDNPAPPLTFAIATQPKNGTLSFFNKNTGTVAYLPKANFQGKDSFTFTVSNGVTSLPATVTLIVAPATPYANPQTVAVARNTSKSITLSGTDPDIPALPLTYIIFSLPGHGTLSGLNSSTGVVTYTPATSFSGTDSFQFTVSNGTNVSARATVTLVVNPLTPTANAQTVAVAHNTAKSITLTGSDPDSPPVPLTFAIAAPPTHGTLSGLNPATGVVTYTPASNYGGSDSFTFTVSNGVNTSIPAKVTITVAPGVPTANAQTVTVVHNTAKGLTLTGTDPDNPPLSLKFAIVSSPSHGTLNGLNASTGTVTYTPNANFSGTDSFTFTVTNGTNTSAPAKLTLNVSSGGG